MSVRCIGGGMGLAVAVLALSSCGTPAPSVTATARPTPTPLARPSAAAGPCASVTTTTGIDQVPAACAALWAPYGVTKVPPANLTDSTPAPPAVVNATGGAVSDADARAWALAANRGAVWYRWAEAQDQPKLLEALGKITLIPSTELQVLYGGGTVEQPDCAIFPVQMSVFSVTQSAVGFFSSLGQVVDGGYVLVASYPGPCTITAKTAAGSSQVIASYPGAGSTFFAGSVRHDRVLGDVWFTDGAASCQTRDAPAAWCR